MDLGRFLATWLLVFVCVEPQLVEGQAAKPPAAQHGWLEHWRLSTLSFGQIKKENGREYFDVGGTGLFVTPDNQSLYIITAKHVFDDPKKKWHPKELHLRFAWQERKSLYDDLGMSLSLLDSSGKPKWVAPEDGADLAAIPFDIKNFEGKVTSSAIHLTDIVTDEDMFEGASVVVLGYPGIVGNDYLVRAISRGGIIAWFNPEDRYNKPFMIDANIYPGNSGGPVIRPASGMTKTGTLNLGGRAKLAGIVSQASIFKSDLTITIPEILKRFQLMQEIPLGGTGIIEPASKIPDLLKRFSQSK